MKRIIFWLFWGGLFGSQTGCYKSPPPGPITILGKAYIYGNRDPVANAVFKIIWVGQGSTEIDTVHSDANGHFRKQIFPTQFPKNEYLHGIRLEHLKLPNYAYDNQIQYWYGAPTEGGVVVFERMYYPAGTKHLVLRKTTNTWDQIDIQYESMYRMAKYQLNNLQPFAFDSIVGQQLRTKEIYLEKTNFQSGRVEKDTLIVNLKYKTPDTLFLNF